MNPRQSSPSFFAALVGLLVLAFGASAADEGLRVSDDGVLLLRGQPFQGYGVNYYDAFNRTLGTDPKSGYDEGFAELAKRKIPFARFAACGYWPNDQRRRVC